MEHQDHVNLLRPAIHTPGGVWADLGAGRGAFTLALADLLGPGSQIYAVDRAAESLRANADALRARFPDISARHIAADFTKPLDLPPLDGAVMANSLHFQKGQIDVVRAVRGYLAPGGRLVVVEYDIEHPNPAVPYPIPSARWHGLAREAGFANTKVLARRPSRTMGEIYSAAAW